VGSTPFSSQEKRRGWVENQEPLKPYSILFSSFLTFGQNSSYLALILCIETSAKACTVALSENGIALDQQKADGEWKHSKVITLLISATLDAAGRKLTDLDAVAVSQGPGSYTGLRVGASCAKGLCYGSDLKLIAIPTLHIIAQAQLDSAAEFIVPMIDARRMEVYYKMLDNHLKTVKETDNLILTPEAFQPYEARSLRFCGDGAHKMKEFALPEGWSIAEEGAMAQHMAPLAEQRFQGGFFEDVAYYAPFYLKPPNITKSTKPLF